MSDQLLGVRVTRDVVYRTVDGVDLHVDVYEPEAGAARAAVVYFHGGGFLEGTRADYEAVRQAALARAGFLVVAVQYRFITDAPFPAFLDDARAAVAWTRAYAAEHGVPSERVGAWGSSAGGTIAALLGLGEPAAGVAPDVQASVAYFAGLDTRLLSGGTELELLIHGTEHGPIEIALGGVYDSTNPEHRRIDPLSQVSPAASPTLLVSGDTDRVIDARHSERFFEALSAAGVDARLHLAARFGHEDARLDTPSTIGLVVGFFDETLAGGTIPVGAA